MTDLNDKQALWQTAEQVYRYMIAEHAPASTKLASTVDVDPASWGLDINQWNWNPGVGITSISAYYDARPRPDVLDYLKQWVDRNKAKSGKFQHVNYMTPFAIFPDMYRRTSDRYYLDTAADMAAWIVKNSARTLTGAFQHGGDLTEQIWADTVFMVVLFLARLARLVDDRALAEEASRQLQLHLQYLQDPQAGVLFHGYDCKAQNHKSGAHWTRGNAWITLAAPLILSEIAPVTGIPAGISGSYRRLVDGLLRYQAANGLWHTVIDRPDLYQETSGSAGIACGILKAVRSGLLPASYRRPAAKALQGVLSTIQPDGAVTGVSGGTPIMNTIEEYGQLSRYPTLYGQGLTLMLLAEYLTG